MPDFTNNFENLSIRFMTTTGISLGRLPNGDFVVSACDLLRLWQLRVLREVNKRGEVVGYSPRQCGQEGWAQVKIGDTVAWADVPSGALVRYGQILYMRVGDAGWGVGHSARVLGSFGRYCDGEEGKPWVWEPEPQSVTILALGLTGSETKETLRMLVRHFEESAATRQ